MLRELHRVILSRPGCRAAASRPTRGKITGSRRSSPTPHARATMARMDDYLEVNRLNWDERAAVHAASAEYGFDRFVTDPGAPQRRRALRPPAARRRDRADRHPPAVPHRHRHPVAGPARRADDRPRPVAGVAGAGPPARGRRRAPTSTTSRPTPTPHRRPLGGRTFDLVYTGIGALCWLPDIDRWAGVVDDLLEPGGRLFVREGHPMMWAVDETAHRRAHPRLRLLRDARAVRPRGVGHLRRERPRVRQHPPAVLEPRHRRDPDRPAGPRVRGHRVRRAPQRALGRPARPDGARRRPRRVAPGRRGGAAAAVVHAAGPQAGRGQALGPRAAEPGEEALVVDDHALDGAAADDGPHGIRRLDLEAEAAARRRPPPAPRR